MNAVLVIVGAVTALFKMLGVLASTLSWRRAMEAGRTEFAKHALERTLDAVEKRHEIENDWRGLDPDAVNRRLRDKWQRD